MKQNGKRARFTVDRDEMMAFQIDGFDFEAVKWNKKTRSYWPANGRHPLAKTVEKELIGVAQDAVSEWVWEQIRKTTHDFMNHAIERNEWRRNVVHSLRQRTAAQRLVCNGGLDATRKHVESTIESVVSARLHEKADVIYLDDLCAGIDKGVFGSGLELNDFMGRMRLLLRPEIYDFSPSHERLAEAILATLAEILKKEEN